MSRFFSLHLFLSYILINYYYIHSRTCSKESFFSLSVVMFSILYRFHDDDQRAPQGFSILCNCITFFSFFCLFPVFFTLVDFYYGYSVQFGFILSFLKVSLYLILQMFSFFSIIFIRSDGERFAKEWYGWPFGPKTKQNRHSRHLDENPVMFRWERCKKSLRRLGRK